MLIHGESLRIPGTQRQVGDQGLGILECLATQPLIHRDDVQPGGLEIRHLAGGGDIRVEKGRPKPLVDLRPGVCAPQSVGPGGRTRNAVAGISHHEVSLPLRPRETGIGPDHRVTQEPRRGRRGVRRDRRRCARPSARDRESRSGPYHRPPRRASRPQPDRRRAGRSGCAAHLIAPAKEATHNRARGGTTASRPAPTQDSPSRRRRSQAAGREPTARTKPAGAGPHTRARVG